jgi:hypothetical protein
MLVRQPAIKRAETSAEPLGELLFEYKYQPGLTPRLDALGPKPFTQEIINEIVLWKVNRYVDLSAASLEALNRVALVDPKSHRSAGGELEVLLGERGVDLAMASALLRFRNPKAFQIIDRHAYRALRGEPYPLHNSSTLAKKIDIYFDYLDRLFVLAEAKEVSFEVLDRVLYEFDKKENGNL